MDLKNQLEKELGDEELKLKKLKQEREEELKKMIDEMKQTMDYENNKSTLEKIRIEVSKMEKYVEELQNKEEKEFISYEIEIKETRQKIQEWNDKADDLQFMINSYEQQ